MPTGRDYPPILLLSQTSIGLMVPKSAAFLAWTILGGAESLCDVECRLASDFVEDDVEIVHYILIGLRYIALHLVSEYSNEMAVTFVGAKGIPPVYIGIFLFD